MFNIIELSEHKYWWEGLIGEDILDGFDEIEYHSARSNSVDMYIARYGKDWYVVEIDKSDTVPNADPVISNLTSKSAAIKLLKSGVYSFTEAGHHSSKYSLYPNNINTGFGLATFDGEIIAKPVFYNASMIGETVVALQPQEDFGWFVYDIAKDVTLHENLTGVRHFAENVCTHLAPNRHLLNVVTGADLELGKNTVAKLNKFACSYTEESGKEGIIVFCDMGKYEGAVFDGKSNIIWWENGGCIYQIDPVGGKVVSVPYAVAKSLNCPLLKEGI